MMIIGNVCEALQSNLSYYNRATPGGITLKEILIRAVLISHFLAIRLIDYFSSMSMFSIRLCRAR